MRTRTPPDRLPELMDAPDCDEDDLADALDVLAESARRFGGNRLLRRGVERVIGSPPADGSRLRVLDVGAGGGDGALALRGELIRAGWAPRFTLADLHEKTLALCLERVAGRLGEEADAVDFVRLDGSRLPFADDAFDVAVSTMTFHHLADRAAADFVSELERVTRRGWVVTDLRRSVITFATIGVVAATAWRSLPFPRADGPRSVRRSFKPREIRGLLDRLGLPRARVRPHVLRWIAWSE